jgi:4'-phosphopantetheinyl transferase
MADSNQDWALPPSPVFLSGDEVHLWRASLRISPAVLQTLLMYLSPDEAKRAAQFRFPRDREHFIAARGILRTLLAQYLLVDPASLCFSTNAYGKPALLPTLNTSNLCFNLSHSHELALFAFSYSRDLGVDVEYRRREIEYDQLARFCFSLYEQQVFFSLAGELKHEAFYNCWTRKEAYVKARGLGLSLPLTLFDVSLLPSEPARLLESREAPTEVARWSLRSLAPGLEYAGALAVEGQEWLLRSWDWSSPHA